MQFNKNLILNYLRSSIIVISTLYVFIIQGFIPVFSADVSCSNGIPTCVPSGTPICSGGKSGEVICSNVFGPSCRTSLSIFPGSVTCTTSNCVVCPQVIPLCQPGYKLVPQTCSQCAYCEPVICPILSCPAPPTGCTYINIPKDINGCPTGCGTLSCQCNPPPCPAPPSGCTYINIPRDENGCQTGCGTLSCQCNPPPCPAPPTSCTYINIPRDENGCQTGCGTLNCPGNCSLVPIPLSPYTNSFSPQSRVSEANTKLSIANERKTVLENLKNAIINNTTKPCVVSGVNNSSLSEVTNAINGINSYISLITNVRDFWTSFSSFKFCLVTNIFFNTKLRFIVNLEGLISALYLGQEFDADPSTPGIQAVSGIGVYGNNASNSAYMFSVLTQERLTIQALQSDIDCSFPINNPCQGSFRTLNISGNADSLEPVSNIRYSIVPIPLSPYTVNMSIVDRLAEINTKITVANIRIGDLQYLLAAIFAGETLSCAVSGLTTLQNPNGLSDPNLVKAEIAKVKLYLNDLNRSKSFYSSISSINICLDTNPNFNVYLEKVFNYEGLLTALRLGQEYDYDPNTQGLQPVPGINNSDSNTVFTALESAKNSVLAIANNPVPCSTSSSSGGPSCTVSSNCPIGTCPSGMTYQKYNCLGNQCILINYLVDPCATSSSSSGSTAQCGSAICRNGEVCVVIDPCRGRPNCSGQISQFCALPNASPFCSNGSIMCNTGSPLCTNSSTNIPTCGSSLGFVNDLSGPGCRNVSSTVLSVNSAYCTTGILRSSDEDTTSCNTKKLCPSGKRFNSCREDKQACKCICPFDLASRGTPRCTENNKAVCSRGLTPTCSNPDNLASCYSKKLTCANKNDGSIDLNDTIKCK